MSSSIPWIKIAISYSSDMIKTFLLFEDVVEDSNIAEMDLDYAKGTVSVNDRNTLRLFLLAIIGSFDYL